MVFLQTAFCQFLLRQVDGGLRLPTLHPHAAPGCSDCNSTHSRDAPTSYRDAPWPRSCWLQGEGAGWEWVKALPHAQRALAWGMLHTQGLRVRAASHPITSRKALPRAQHHVQPWVALTLTPCTALRNHGCRIASTGVQSLSCGHGSIGSQPRGLGQYYCLKFDTALGLCVSFANFPLQKSNNTL